MTTNAFKSVVLVCAIAIAASSSFAQQAVTRVEGKITDEITGKPVGCKVYVYNEAGERVRSLRSNSADGTYLAVVNDAGKHKFVLAGHNVYRSEYFVEVPSSTKFQEVDRDFTVKMFAEGFVLYEGAAFELNSAVITPAASESLKEVIEAVTVNQQLNLNIIVTVDQDQMAGMVQDSITKFLKDSIDWAKAMKKYERKYRKRKNKPEPPVEPIRPVLTEDPNTQLLSDRTKAVKALFSDLRNADIRIVVKGAPLDASLVKEAPDEEAILKDLTAKKKKSKKKSSDGEAQEAIGHSTMVVKIGEVKRLFD